MMESSDEEEGEASGVGQELVTQGEGEGDVSQRDAAAAAAAAAAAVPPPQTDSLQRRVDSTEIATAASAAAAASALASSSHDTTPPADFRLKGRVPLRRASHFRLERPQEDGGNEPMVQEGVGEVGSAPKLVKDSQVHCDVPHYTCDV